MARLFPFCCVVLLLFMASFAHAGGPTGPQEASEETCKNTKVIFECYNCQTGDKLGTWETNAKYKAAFKSCVDSHDALSYMCMRMHELGSKDFIGVKYWYDINGKRWSSSFFNHSKIDGCPAIGR